MKTPELPLPIQDSLNKLNPGEKNELTEKLVDSYIQYESPQLRGSLALIELTTLLSLSGKLFWEAYDNAQLPTVWGLVTSSAQVLAGFGLPIRLVRTPLGEMVEGKPLSHILENAYSEHKWTTSVEQFCKSEGILK